mmetsp:Transcript_38897/g.91601  ORF Transcript_38897/g.91601 Transcript_38897/m.91601 type:complete len:204 (-) Transcript_38897:1249-1860(-)
MGSQPLLWSGASHSSMKYTGPPAASAVLVTHPMIPAGVTDTTGIRMIPFGRTFSSPVCSTTEPDGRDVTASLSMMSCARTSASWPVHTLQRGQRGPLPPFPGLGAIKETSSWAQSGKGSSRGSYRGRSLPFDFPPLSSRSPYLPPFSSLRSMRSRASRSTSSCFLPGFTDTPSRTIATTSWPWYRGLKPASTCCSKVISILPP